MKIALLIFVLLIMSEQLVAQKYSVTSGEISFFSDAAIEDIKATNKKTQGLFNIANGDFAFVVPIRSFEFEKKLMQEHFNEKYLESEKYPKATFQGKVDNFNSTLSGVQAVTARGKFTIHGVTKDVAISVTIEYKDNTMYVLSKFIIVLQDYDVEIPQLLWQNIAEQVEVNVSLLMKPIEK